MKRFILCTLLVVAFGVYNHAQAQFRNSEVAWGFSAGGAQGNNDAGDKWGMQYRGFLQFDLFSSTLIGQVGVGLTELSAPGVYSTETGTADLRLLLSPFSLPNLNPYLYAGFGVSKELNNSGTEYLPMVPFGAGIQTRISSGVLLAVSGGYNLSLSDKLDGRDRTNTDLNSLTNTKQDGFYGFSVGLAFTIRGGYDAAAELQKKELAEAEARRVKQQADADAEALRVKQATDTEARNIKALADAEALRVKQKSEADAKAQSVKESTDAEARRVKGLADAEAQRVKEASDAEARRVKELADAEARRLAEQKDRDNNTIIVLEKGKTVVLKGVSFEFNKATLTNESETILTRAYNALVANPDVQVEISGHTDNVGSEQYNQVLSLKRAQAVKNWLVQKGIASNRMKTVGKGENEPVASNATDTGRAENRRIEFYVQQ